MIGRDFGTFAVKDLIMPQKLVGLHMWELGLTVWVHFCLLESAMLWLIFTFSSFICGSVGEVEFDMESFGDVSEVES